jgi:hypothetical protein
MGRILGNKILKNRKKLCRPSEAAIREEFVILQLLCGARQLVNLFVTSFQSIPTNWDSGIDQFPWRSLAVARIAIVVGN